MRARNFYLGCFIGIASSALAYVLWISLLPIGVQDQKINITEAVQPNFLHQDEELKLILNAQSSATRHLRLLEFTQRLDYDQLVQLIDQFQKLNTDFYEFSFRKHIYKRLSSLNPRKTFNRVRQLNLNQRRQLIPIVFQRWARLNFDEAIREARQLRGELRDLALRHALITQDDLFESNFVQQATSLGIESNLRELQLERQIHDEKQLNPAKALRLIFSGEISESRKEVLFLEVAESWLHNDGLDTSPILLQELAQYSEDSLQDLDSKRYETIQSVTMRIVERDPAHFWQVVLANPITLQDDLIRIIQYVWMPLDPQATIDATNNLPVSELKRNAYRSLVRVWAHHDSDGLMRNIQTIPTEHRSYAIEWAAIELARVNKVQEALNYLNGFEEQGENVSLATERVCVEWAKTDPQAATSWTLANTKIESPRRHDLLTVILPLLAEDEPSQAIALAKENLDPNFAGTLLALDVHTIRTVAHNRDFINALAMFEEVSDPSRLLAATSLGNHLIENNWLEEAIKLGNSLDDSEREDYFVNLVPYWSSRYPIELYEFILETSTENLQEQLIKETLRMQHWSANLTESESETLADLLPIPSN